MTRRLLLSYLTVTLVALLLLEIPLGMVFAQREIERRTAELDRDASIVATIYEDDLERGRPLDPFAALSYELRTGARVVVVDVDGISRVDTELPAPRDLSTRPEIATALAGRRSSGVRRSETLDTDLLYVAIPVASGGTVHGALRLTLDTAATRAQVVRFWAGLTGVGAVVLLAAALVGWLLARSVTRPVRRLQATAERFASGDLRVLSDGRAAGPPELRSLEQTLSFMAERLAVLLEEQRAFVADASHQLRTPLTALRLRLENLHERVGGADADDVELAIEETERLGRLVTELLHLARADQPRTTSPHDLVTIAIERVDTWSALADAAGVNLALTAPTPARPRPFVAAVDGAIEQILDNLIDNAIAASPAGATVTVTVAPEDGRAETTQRAWRLTVADCGPGLDDEQKEHALRRFWRASDAQPGSGLGLPIAAALAASCGGTLRLEDNPGGGLLALVVFREAAPVAT